MSRGERILVGLCVLFAGVVFVTGIHWGLPSRQSDEFLFGKRAPWTGAQILELAPLSDDPNRGADVDADPLAGRDRLLVLNKDDKHRAEIVRRYRLFTHQPDEYNTLKSLSEMKPGGLQLDPKMYQYGGLWVYPVGAILKVASMVKLIELKPDKAFYLDHPEQFARFYVAARLYSAAWGVVGAWAVFRLARKLAGSAIPAAVASACWACTPVILTMSHEAKPHLAGLVLMLLAILAACRYVEGGATRWALLAGALCGAALGMVLSSAIIFVILPLMTLARPVPWGQRVRVMTVAGLVGVLVYAVTNPYVWINLFRNPAVLRSNLGTTTGMYEASGGSSGLVNAMRLIAEGTSFPLALVGGLALIVLLTPRLHRALSGAAVPLHLVWLLAGPALVVAVMFAVLAKGKPAEYARFALLPDTALCISAVTLVWLLFRSRLARGMLLGALLVGVAMPGAIYLGHFVADTRQPTTRLAEARQLAELRANGLDTLAIAAEPAPYVMPPVDLWDWRIQLLPRGQDPVQAARDSGADVLIRAVDRLPEEVPDGFVRLEPIAPSAWLTPPSPVSWAAKPFEVLVARRPIPTDSPAATSPAQTPARP